MTHSLPPSFFAGSRPVRQRSRIFASGICHNADNLLVVNTSNAAAGADIGVLLAVALTRSEARAVSRAKSPTRDGRAAGAPWLTACSSTATASATSASVGETLTGREVMPTPNPDNRTTL